ncbi:MAG: DHA2 family efflux MFS transporter permease subunit [Aestuariivirgaceae bacterium]
MRNPIGTLPISRSSEKPLRPGRIIPLVVASALFMENLDSSVIATSLPAIAVDIGADPIVLKLAFTAYLLSLAIFIPISGWCADRFGARSVFRAAIAIFTVASLACGFAQSLEALVAARFLQGLGGALMVPVGRIIMLRLVPKAELLGAMALLTMPALVGPLVGPPIGGFITTYFHWRWIFWINIPFGILGIVLASRYMPKLTSASVPKLDLTGFLLVGLGLAATIFGLTTLSRSLLPPLVAPILTVIGMTLLGIYVIHARRISNAILDLRLLKVETFRSSLLGGSLFRIGAGAIPFLLPLLLQVGFGLNAFQTGLLMFASAIGAMSMKLVAIRLLQRFGFRQVLIVNVLIGSALLGANALLTAHTPYWVMFALFLTGGFFRSLQFTSVNALAYADMGEGDMSRASTFSNVAQQLSASLGVALAAFVVEALLEMDHGRVLGADELRLAFIAVAAVSATAILVHLRLPPEAGHALSGHGLPRRQEVPAE